MSREESSVEYYDSESVFRAWRGNPEDEFFISRYKLITEDPEDWDNFVPIGYSGIRDKEAVKTLLSFMDTAYMIEDGRQ